MQIVDVEQGSPEWFELREKRMTGSHGQAISANGKGLITYINKKMAAYHSTAPRIHYTNADLARGTIQEPMAILAYEFKYNVTVQKIGFVIHNEYIGASPDGFVESDGMIEVKSRNDEKFHRYSVFSEKLYEKKDERQMEMNMLVCKKKWCDFIAYNPNLAPYLFVKRFYPNPENIAKLEAGFESGIQMIKDSLETFKRIRA